MTLGDAILYLRQSDFRDEGPGALDARVAELREVAAELGDPDPLVLTENDDGDGRLRGVSAFKALDMVAANGLQTWRTRRPVYRDAMLLLQSGERKLLVVSDESRLTRDHRDGYDLLDAIKHGGSVVALDEEGGHRWVLRDGGSRAERSAFLSRVDDARKYSEDVAAKVRKGRRRWAGVSWQGGRRPFGFQIKAGTEEHARNLVKDEAEAAELVQAADRLLGGTSLRWCVQDLRDRGVPTVTGARWSTRTLRDALAKPATAGLAVKGGSLIKAPWPHILEREKWDQVRALLSDPARRTNEGRGNEPKHLASLIAECGVCGKPLRIGGAGVGRGSAYVGTECGHIRRDAAKVDHVVEAGVLYLLERPELAGRLRLPARPGVDVAALHGELARLDLDAQRDRDAATDGRLDRENLYELLAANRRRQEAIRERIAASAPPVDVLAAFEARPARAVWAGLPVSARRAVVRRLFERVVILPAGRGNRFDPTRVKLTARGDLGDVPAGA
jgi:site-specific DNA recombinase